MTRVLLVTGSRSLADSADAERWARAKIAEALAGCDLLIVGAADGPDAWAYVEAVREGMRASRALPTHKYYARGSWAGYVYRYERPSSYAPWCDAVPLYGTPQRRRLPLLRNAAMVADCKRLAAEGATVSVLALLDGRKPAKPAPGEKRRTWGTEHTAGLAERAGLTVRREVWPPAPKGTP